MTHRAHQLGGLRRVKVNPRRTKRLEIEWGTAVGSGG